MKKYVIKMIYMLLISTLILVYAAAADEVDNGIPVVELHIDETAGATIEEMNNSEDHSVYCTGTIDIKVPEGFTYCDMPDTEIKAKTGLAMTIRGRGNSTWGMDKKPYKIKLEDKENLFGLGKSKHWVLIANRKDTTLAKDRVVAILGEKLGFEFTPMGVPVDVVMNGEYLGSYMFFEQVRVEKNRLNLEELEEDDTDPEIITGDYLIQEGSQVDKDSPNVFYTTRRTLWANHTPSFDPEDDGYENEAQMNYIRNYIQKFEDALYSENFEDEDGLSYSDYMDMESAAKYWLVQEVTLNPDAFGTGSTYFYKKRDSVLYWGPLWDFDLAWGECYYEYMSDEDYENEILAMEGFAIDHTWIKAMLYDEAFREEVYKQWPTVRDTLLEMTEDNGLIDQFYEETKESQADDFTLWHPSETNNFRKDIVFLKEQIRHRVNWMDEHLRELDSAVCRVTFKVEGSDDRIEYFPKDERVIFFIPEKEGYIFLGWTEEDGNDAEDYEFAYEDRTFTAKFIDKEHASKFEEIYLRSDDEWVDFSRMFFLSKYVAFPLEVQDHSISWSSSDETIASVDETGLVEFHQTGIVTITATLASGESASYTLTIVDGNQPMIESLSIDPEEMELTVGEHSQIKYILLPKLAAYDEIDYSTDNDEVADVYNSGVVIAKKPGTAVITIRAYYYDGEGNETAFTKTCTVTVKEENQGNEPGEKEPDNNETGDDSGSKEPAGSDSQKAEEKGNDTKSNTEKSPKTGDSVRPEILFVIMVASVLLFAWGRKKHC